MILNDALESILTWIEGNTGVAYALNEIKMAENSMADGDKDLRGFMVTTKPHTPTNTGPASMIVATYSLLIAGVLVSSGVESLYGELEFRPDEQGFVVVPVQFRMTLRDNGMFVHTIHFAFKNGRLFSVE